MGDVLGVHIVKSKQNLFDDVCGLHFVEVLDFNKSVEELASFQKLSNNVVVLIVFEQLFDVHDVRVR